MEEKATSEFKLGVVRDKCQELVRKYHECIECPAKDVCTSIGGQFEDFPVETEKAFALFKKTDDENVVLKGVNSADVKEGTPITLEDAKLEVMSDELKEFCDSHFDNQRHGCDGCPLIEMCMHSCDPFDTHNKDSVEKSYRIMKEYKRCREVESPENKGRALHEAICVELNDIYARKNHDYGDSFHKSFAEEGMAMPRIRIGDKFNRFVALSKTNDAKVKDESIEDTLLDLANYAIMTVMEIRRLQNENN